MRKGQSMKKSVVLWMLLVSWFLCGETARADLVWGPPILEDVILKVGLTPFILGVIAITFIIILKINNRK